MNHLPLMARFNHWVNERLYDCVARLPEEDYRADRKAFFGSIHNTLNHLLVVDRLWTRRIEGRDHGIRSLDQILHCDFDGLRAARRVEDRHLIDLVDGLDKARLSAPVTYRRIIGEGLEQARTDHILITLFNHQTHHRGQVHAMLTQCDIEPPALDVIFFLDEVGEAGPVGTLDDQAP
ncbi:MAG: DinB family protein [Rhodospirillales bacterium]|nr:DinB family protein [Rhodospirillales bacterium]